MGWILEVNKLKNPTKILIFIAAFFIPYLLPIYIIIIMDEILFFYGILDKKELTIYIKAKWVHLP